MEKEDQRNPFQLNYAGALVKSEISDIQLKSTKFSSHFENPLLNSEYLFKLALFF